MRPQRLGAGYVMKLRAVDVDDGKTRTDVMTWHYVFCMGMYRAFYLLNWVWRYMTQEGYSDWIVWVAGIVQTILYLDFFYYYIKCKLDGKQVALPQ